MREPAIGLQPRGNKAIWYAVAGWGVVSQLLKAETGQQVQIEQLVLV
uniref:Uncharacterized protein n=1 Tax=Arundo donax TaxID=35708 RepID=A0A0A9QI86_ARUDO